MSSKFIVILRGLQWKWNGIQVEIRFKREGALQLRDLRSESEIEAQEPAPAAVIAHAEEA
jgi:hypothetical protein